MLETTLDQVPMFIRAGSILPLGPEMQYVGEKTWNNLELHIYPGADGTFTLYEDEGDGYNYEKDIYTTITFHWNDKARKLTIGRRKGQYPGMLQQRTFTVIWPDGSSQVVTYDGNEIVL
jgi:alpha-D-xyloside xylohydrolase